ncbi:MAG: hypothetical protein MJZ33_10505 [Paludibacteraceae bacterium]|nr:hypothetical protein [Paludibacteraceae bacterium]
MKTLKSKNWFLCFFIFLFGCSSIGEERNRNMSCVYGELLQKINSQERISQFFNSEEGSFLPMGKWLLDFDYKENKKKLYLTLLNVSESNQSEWVVSVSDNTITIEEGGASFSNSIVTKDLKYALENVQPKKYTLKYKGLSLELDLTDIDKKSKYSLLDDGSYVIVSNERANMDEV